MTTDPGVSPLGGVAVNDLAPATPPAGAETPATPPAATPPAGEAAATPPGADVGQQTGEVKGATDGSLAGGGKPEGEAPAPFKFEDVKLPEGLTLSEAQQTLVGDLAAKHNLSAAALSDLMEVYGNEVKQAQEAGTQLYAQTQENWVKEVKADKDIGGDKLAGVLATIAKVRDDPKLTDPKFAEALNFTGAGNHPAVVKTLYNWAKALNEGGPVKGSPSGQAKITGPSAKAMYPNLPE